MLGALSTSDIVTIACAAGTVIIGWLAYAVGLFHPVAIKRPRYRRAQGGGVTFTCFIRNRKVKSARTLTGIGFVVVPRWRWLHREWRKPGPARYLPGGVQAANLARSGQVIGTRDSVKFDCELLDSTGQPLGAGDPIDPRTFVMARFGASRPAVKKIKPE